MGKTEIIITIILFNILFIAFVIAIVVFIIQYRIKKKEHKALLQSQFEAHQKELLATQIEIQHQTMQHIGREIHDSVGQKLTLASLYTQQLAYENKAPQITENIENISAIINQSLSELRELSKSLTDNYVDSTSLSQLLKEEFNRIKELKVCTVTFTSTLRNTALSYQTKSVLFRITQEFLQNSIKHSKCRNIVGQLTQNQSTITLSIYDDGIGFDTSYKYNGIGLQNIKKRTEIIGGTLNLQSTSTGTQLFITIPTT